VESSASRGRNAFLTTAGVLAALALVAVASRGSISAGAGEARKPSSTLLDVMFGLYLVAVVAGAALFVYLMVLNRHARAQGGKSPRRNILVTLGTFLALVTIGVLVAERLATFDRTGQAGSEQPIAPETAPDGATAPEATPAANGFAWLPTLVTAGLVVLAVAAWWFAGRARRRARGELMPAFAQAIGQAVDESLDDLRAEPDPRRAVIAAYARLEGVLARHDLPRAPAEAPLEYLGRMLEELSVNHRAARRLTDLFERARFSQHAVGPEMKEQAIAALESVRDDLRAAQALAELEKRAAA
jgi:Domain of unknown function (DUF4129)